MTEVKNMSDLVNRSIKVTTGMVKVIPQRQEKVHVEGVEELVQKFPDCYTVNNSTVSYVYAGNLYVTLSTKSVRKVLSEYNFEKISDLPVPFSNYDFPLNLEKKWNKIKLLAIREESENFIKDCNDLAKKLGIKTLDRDILDNSFCIPERGVRIKNKHYEQLYYPVCIPGNWIGYIEEKIGTYTECYGVVCFVDCNGFTYVTRGGKKLINKLRAAGFREGDLPVPFGSNEVILDKAQREAWEKVVKY